ncbi:16S rRNA (guanine(527)-N(7))-methyltransferase RsmG [Algihabitans albus]|uniref:16S rRNA (guanine(527)-N(7))-methyltransferase RsmG n=1 Tax=Algihabitans albus TaxID=2164067 RepID=UPI000E5D1927|nr:16S rRNA (guanine(527)-N(7))-methyltransferase RsmG [Algihabitans albus]
MTAALPAETYGSIEFQRETGVSRETMVRLQIYADLLVKWNRAINLVGPATLPDLWRRHMLDSAQLLPLLPLRDELTIADLGSGAGFPGLVLTLCGAGHVHLVESDQKKATFLRQVLRETGATADIHCCRIETLHDLHVDIVTARALAPLPALVAHARPLLKSDGLCLFLKGRGVGDELTQLPKALQDRCDRVPSRSDPAGCILRLEGPLP